VPLGALRHRFVSSVWIFLIVTSPTTQQPADHVLLAHCKTASVTASTDKGVTPLNPVPRAYGGRAHRELFLRVNSLRNCLAKKHLHSRFSAFCALNCLFFQSRHQRVTPWTLRWKKLPDPVARLSHSRLGRTARCSFDWGETPQTPVWFTPEPVVRSCQLLTVSADNVSSPPRFRVLTTSQGTWNSWFRARGI